MMILLLLFVFSLHCEIMLSVLCNIISILEFVVLCF
jgi:hypothetical protein